MNQLLAISRLGSDRRSARLLAAAFIILAGSVLTATARADGPRVLAAGKLPNDSRLGPLRTLDSYFPFAPSANYEDWLPRAERIRRQVLVATGLWPMPTKTPANAVIHGRIDRDDYTVEKVYLESFPGHFVTGSLYRPKGNSGKLPGVLLPYGHFPKGRFNETSVKDVREEFVEGAERFDVGGRYPLQALGVTLARMGCVAFQYDMVGYADSQQIPDSVAHFLKKRRPAMETPAGWGFFSPQAELRLQTIMGLQTYHSLRVLDWFSELPDVDPRRIGVTGASGGGTQTFILGAIDPRPAVFFPAVMVSTAMQGGCTCENCSYLRIDAGNIDFAALIAPRPLGMTAAEDWTQEIATKGLPELKRHYAMLGVPDSVMAKPLLQFGHNYNYVSRAVMYRWMNDRLMLGLENPIVETDFKPLTIAEMSVWDAAHPKPPSGDDYERSLLRWMTDDARRQLAALTPNDPPTLAEFRRVVGGAFDVMIGRGLPAAGEVEWKAQQNLDRADFVATTALVHYRPGHEELPVVLLKPKQWNQRVVVWIDAGGKAALFHGDDANPAVRRLLAAGIAVVGVDLFEQGEFLADGKPLTKTRRVEKSRDAACFTFGYNRPLFAQRVDDILSVVAAVQQFPDKTRQIDLLGTGGAGPLAAAARAQAGPAIERLAIDTAGFRFADLRSIDDPNFLPGAVKYGDLEGLIALSAPGDLWITGEGLRPMVLVTAAYFAAGQASHLTMDQNTGPGAEGRAIDWLLKVPAGELSAKP